MARRCEVDRRTLTERWRAAAAAAAAATRPSGGHRKLARCDGQTCRYAQRPTRI